MATLRQILANQQNSEKSTGPKTEEGKAAARANALKHGLTGAGVVMSPDDAEAVASRMDAWRPNYQPATNEDEWLFRELVTQSIRLDHCHEQEAALRINISLRASLCWDDDRQLDAQCLGERLAKKPAKLARELAATKQGCEWMLDRWRSLDAILETGGEWTDAQRSLALDLLGTPAELRDPADAFGHGAGGSEARDLILLETARLERLKTESLEPLDEFEQTAAEQGLLLRMPRTLAQLRRYEAACLQRYHAARARLLPTAPAVSEPPAYINRPEPAPAPAPVPRPVSEPPVQPRVETAPRPSISTARCAMSPAPSQPMNRQQRRAAAKYASKTR